MNQKLLIRTMTSDRYCNSYSRVTFGFLLAVALFMLGLHEIQAQPTIVSTVPSMGASGVSPAAAVVFTFSEAMDTNATTAEFLDISNPLTPFNTTPAWDVSGKVLTCTPNPAFPSNKQIYWVVSGQNPGGDQLGGTPGGIFTTGSGGGGTGGGSGTNRITTFTAGALYSYDQTSAGSPTLDTNAAFAFEAVTSLASNRTATAISLTLPGGAISNLTQSFVASESYYLFYYTTVSNDLETRFPAGNYTFTVNATASNQTVSVSLPPSTTQPNAPQVSNYLEAQSVNASQPFTLKWNAFSGGGAGDYISVTVSGNADVFKTPDFTAPGALNGAATSVTIPAGLLASNTTYNLSIGFYRANWSSNATYAAGTFRASLTSSTLTTAGAAAGPQPVVSNPAWSGSAFGFDVTTVSGQMLTVVSTTDVALPVGSWPVLLSTNSPGSKVHISDPNAASKSGAYYAVRNGP